MKKETPAQKSSAWRKAYVKKYNKTYYQNNKDYFRKWHIAYYHRIRRAAIDAYGGKCTCCGETEYGFLTIDHVFGGGRKELETVSTMIFKLRNAGYPKKGYTVLCYNCNCAKGHLGVCPHKRKK